MKIFHIIPLLLLIGCGPKDVPPAVVLAHTNTVAPASPASRTLTVQKTGKVIANPTEADIKAAVVALDDSEVGPRLVLSTKGGADQLELTGTPRWGFAFDYREGVPHEGAYVFASKKTDYSAEAAIKLLAAYLSGRPDWKKMAEWEQFQM